MVLRGGENIDSSEVENILNEHPAVTDCAVIGIAHRTLGEEPAAVVHLAPGLSATEPELQAWVGARLAAFKVPVAVRFAADTLPRNANGKILNKDLKALFADRDAIAPRGGGGDRERGTGGPCWVRTTEHLIKSPF